MVGLKDVAKECGISVTQVSRALNGHNDVSEKTRKLVEKTAKEMGYVKNIAAQMLVTQKSKQIALFHKGINDNNKLTGSMLVKMLKGINEFVSGKGWESVLYLVDNFDVSYLDYCKQRNIPGVILTGMEFDDERYLELIESDFPCVVIDIPIEGENKGCVLINNVFYTMAGVEKLIAKGRKRIAMLCGHDHAVVSIERKNGYQIALTKHGILYDDSIVENADFDYDKAYEKTIELMKNDSSIDAFFCQSDIMAIACMKAIKDIGKKVPEDVSVLGFDGMVLCDFTTPSLSTIEQDVERKGYAAAKLIYDIIHGENEENTCLVPCSIVVRESL